MLKKIFGGCHRSMRYYFLNDCNQEEPPNGPDSLVVLNKLDHDSVDERTDPTDWEVDEARQAILDLDIAFGQLLNLVFVEDQGWIMPTVYVLQFLRFQVVNTDEVGHKFFSFGRPEHICI